MLPLKKLVTDVDLNSSSELDDVAKGSDVAVVWVYDSDGANQGFGKKYEKYAALPVRAL